MRRLLICIGALVTLSSHGAMRQYAATVENSEWQVTEQNRLACTLSHPIPGYGDALFTSVASKQLNMEFELDMLLLPKKFDVAAVYSMPPSWMPGHSRKTIADMTIWSLFVGFFLFLSSLSLLSELLYVFLSSFFFLFCYTLI